MILVGSLLPLLLCALAAIPVSKIIAAIVDGAPSVMSVMKPLEKLIFAVAGIDPNEAMTWKQHLMAMLTINAVLFLFAFLMLSIQGMLPLNPDGNPSMTPDLAFNTAISFLVNCDLQHYSGETGLTYFTQLGVIGFLMFTSAATGFAAMAMVFRAIAGRSDLGNHYRFFVLSITRLLLPLSLVLAGILIVLGTPMSLDGKFETATLEGGIQSVSQGPAAAIVAIKQLGTNGGGYYGTNSAHPLENPGFISNLAQTIAILLIPVASIIALGTMLKRKKISTMILSVMGLFFTLFLAVSIWAELGGNPRLTALGVSPTMGNMEGKETRLGPAASAVWGIATTATSNGSVNSMHGSMMPLSTTMQLLDMMINSLFGGIGVGFLNFYLMIILAVFLAGLMVGRTPELFGRKVEAREVKLVMIATLVHPLFILSGTAVAAWLASNAATLDWTPAPGSWAANAGPRGFSEFLYEFTSAAANNGSGLEGLADNNVFWNLGTGLVLLLSRFIPMIAPMAVAGLLWQKKRIPEGPGTLAIETPSFALMLCVVIFIVAALSFLPALALGPIAEHTLIFQN